jgi:hypothetical protein
MGRKEVEKSLKEHDHMFAMFASLKLEGKYKVGSLPIVREFPDVFPEDDSDLSPERERGVKFTIDLMPDTSPVSMAPIKSQRPN